MASVAPHDPDTYPHHPHFISRTDTPTRWDGIRTEWKFRPFDGTEPDPREVFPLPRDVTRGWPADARRAAYDEQETAWVLWEAARRIRGMHAGIRAAAPAWKSYVRARHGMDAAWQQVLDGDDHRFRSNVLALNAAHAAAAQAAAEFDREAAAIADARDQEPWSTLILDRIPSLREVAEQIGIDASDWVVGSDGDYTSRGYGLKPPLTREVRRVIEDHEKQLSELARVLGETPSRVVR